MRISLAALFVVVVAACADAGGGQIDINSLSADTLGEHEHEHGEASQAASFGSGESPDMNLLNTVGDVPDLDMIDVSTGATVNLQSLVDHEKPLLFWFWTPH